MCKKRGYGTGESVSDAEDSDVVVLNDEPGPSNSRKRARVESEAAEVVLEGSEVAIVGVMASSVQEMSKNQKEHTKILQVQVGISDSELKLSQRREDREEAAQRTKLGLEQSRARDNETTLIGQWLESGNPFLVEQANRKIQARNKAEGIKPAEDIGPAQAPPSLDAAAPIASPSIIPHPLSTSPTVYPLPATPATNNVESSASAGPSSHPITPPHVPEPEPNVSTTSVNSPNAAPSIRNLTIGNGETAIELTSMAPIQASSMDI